MLDSDRQDNLIILRECLSDRLIEKLTLAPAKSKATQSKRKSRRRTTPTGDDPVSASDHVREAPDVEALADFVEVLGLSCQIKI